MPYLRVFQSQNGLILTDTTTLNGALSELFQSQNGLILTQTNSKGDSSVNFISIPKWSDFNFSRNYQYCTLKQFQSQNGLILTQNNLSTIAVLI